MSDLEASVTETKAGFHVEGYEKIEYDFTFLDGVFNTANGQLAELYKRWGRCLAVMDRNIYDVYGGQMEAYFSHFDLNLKIHKTMIGEKAKSIETFLRYVWNLLECHFLIAPRPCCWSTWTMLICSRGSIVDSMNDFGIFRKVQNTS